MRQIAFALSLLLFSVVSSAASDEQVEKARQRLYEGGIDEQPLQVQAVLFNPRLEADKTGEGEADTASSPGVTTTVDEIPEE